MSPNAYTCGQIPTFGYTPGKTLMTRLLRLIESLWIIFLWTLADVLAGKGRYFK